MQVDVLGVPCTPLTSTSVEMTPVSVFVRTHRGGRQLWKAAWQFLTR